MDTVYLKVKVKNTDIETEKIRDQALFFTFIAEALCLSMDAIEEIDETNYLTVTDEIKNKFMELTSNSTAKPRGETP